MYTQLRHCSRQSSETLPIKSAATAMLILTGRSSRAGIYQKILRKLWTLPARLSDNSAWLGRATIPLDTWIAPNGHGIKGGTCHAFIPCYVVCTVGELNAHGMSVGQNTFLE